MDVGEEKTAEAIDLVDVGSDNEEDQVEHEVHSLFEKKGSQTDQCGNLLR